MSNSVLARALGAFASARTVRDYERAKRLSARLNREMQLLIVDAAIAARQRIEVMGVLLVGWLW